MTDVFSQAMILNAASFAFFAEKFDKTPSEEVSENLLFAILAVSGAFFILFAIASIFLFRAKRGKIALSKAAHVKNAESDIWREKVKTIQKKHENGVLTDEEAYSTLARIAREYASARLRRDITGKTLADIRTDSQTGSAAKGPALLRQTIEALYPAEFASPEINMQAQEASIPKACGWILNLMERWRS